MLVAFGLLRSSWSWRSTK